MRLRRGAGGEILPIVIRIRAVAGLAAGATFQRTEITDTAVLDMMWVYLDRTFYTTEENAVAVCALGLAPADMTGMKIVVTDLATATKVHILDSKVAGVCLMRRDILTQPYEIPKEMREGVLLSIRYGLGTLRTTAIARITGA